MVSKQFNISILEGWQNYFCLKKKKNPRLSSFTSFTPGGQMHLVIHFCLSSLPTKMQRCAADLKEQVQEIEQSHSLLPGSQVIKNYNITNDIISTFYISKHRRDPKVFLFYCLEAMPSLTTVKLFFIVYFHDYKLLTDCKCR